MDMTGEHRIPAPRDKVWAGLNDPEVLKASIPGCQSLERSDEGGFNATVIAKVGPVKATFKGGVVLSNVNPPESYTISGEGKGGAAGFAKGGADVRLVEEGPELTVLTYTARADVGGKLAQLGSRLIDGTAKKLATEFFTNFSAKMAPPAEAPVEIPAPAPKDEAEPAGGELPVNVAEPAAAIDATPIDDVAPIPQAAPVDTPLDRAVEAPVAPPAEAPPASAAPAPSRVAPRPTPAVGQGADGLGELIQSQFVWVSLGIAVLMILAALIG